MKYSSSNKPLVCMMTNSTCYKNTSTMNIKGVLWHSTGANNPNLRRYVQPTSSDSNYSALISKIGKNNNSNDWNHISLQAGVNGFIGKLADGTVSAVQVLPWNYKPWGCGSGSKGSCNNGWIQFEICEDALSDSSYFASVYKEACELTAYLCSVYNIDPTGYTTFNGVKVPNILCHADSCSLGLGSNHADVNHWFPKFGKSMATARSDVKALMSGAGIEVQTILSKGSEGNEVKELQENLIKLGYSCGDAGADGDFGSATDSAVRAFQKANGLDVDGEVGSATKAKIKALLGQKTTTTTVSTNEIYRVRTSWDNAKSQVGAYKSLESAKLVCDARTGYYVFNSAGEIVYPTNTYSSDIYRIRMTWEDAKTQKGAYKSLAGAKEVCDTLPGYSVFDSKGKRVYGPTASKSSTTTTTETKQTTTSKITPATTYSSVKLASASKDENGTYHGGKAGDQTGLEVKIQDWYSYNWNQVLRPVDPAIAERLAKEAEDGANNSNIGYDQYERNTLYTQAQKVNYQLAKITTPCECDCASFACVCAICAGADASELYKGGNMRVCSNMESAYLTTGLFDALHDDMYCGGKNYLKRGDTLVNTSAHTVIVLQDGAYADTHIKLVKGDGGPTVKKLQELLIKAGYSCGDAGADGDFGDSTDSAVRAFQKAQSLEVDGEAGKDTWSALETVNSNNFVAVPTTTIGNSDSSFTSVPAQTVSNAEVTSSAYVVRVLANTVNIRGVPSATGTITAQVHKGDAFTIVAESDGFGKLKSGAGWINLEYVEKV